MILRAKKMPYRVEGPARREKSVNALVLTNPFYGLLPKKHSTKVSIDAAIALVENGGSLSKRKQHPATVSRIFCAQYSAGVRFFARLQPSAGVWGIRKDPAGLTSGESTPTPYLVGFSESRKRKVEVMFQLIASAIRALSPAFSVPVATVSTETEARALAALLVAQGKRVCIHTADQGFAVEVIA